MDRLRRQPLLGDLRLRDLVDLLADRLPSSGLHAEANPHEPDPEQDRQSGPEHEVGNGLRDREVQRAEVDRNPIVLRELLGGIEFAARKGRWGKRQLDEHNAEQARPHRPAPK